MTGRHIFHLSIPVNDLAAAERFYTHVLGARIGRRNPKWIDVLMWGHQITLQLQPDEVPSPSEQSKRHFGVTLPWGEWEAQAARIAELGERFASPPQVLLADTPDEQAKFYLTDPAHNIIEIKAYRDSSRVVGAGDPTYACEEA